MSITLEWDVQHLEELIPGLMMELTSWRVRAQKETRLGALENLTETVQVNNASMLITLQADAGMILGVLIPIFISVEWVFVKESRLFKFTLTNQQSLSTKEQRLQLLWAFLLASINPIVQLLLTAQWPIPPLMDPALRHMQQCLYLGQLWVSTLVMLM
jgi:hypothetical protein